MTATEKLRRMLDERGNISLPRERIIRCADCEHYHDGRSADGKRYAEPYCLAIGELAYGALFGVDKLDFCSWAERKEEEAHEEEEGGQMTATDELRRLLDERGVEWEQSPQGGWYTTEWTGRYGKCNAMEWKPTLTVMMPNLTPEQAIAATLGTEIDGETSDGYHTFNELYHHRAVLFSVIVKNYRDAAWKAKKHHDGTMYDGMFIVGIDTPWGQASYHYDVEPYWDMFLCRELERAPEWDGHTPDDAIERIGKLATLGGGECERVKHGTKPDGTPRYRCSVCGYGLGDYRWAYCPKCGARIRKAVRR